MANYRDVKGLSVVALAEGKKIGQIEDLVVDPQGQMVRWLRLGSAASSLFGGGGSSWAPVSAVHSVGEHAVTINSLNDVVRSEDAPEAEQMAKTGRALLGKKVISEDGTFLGNARDFSFSPDDFRLEGIVVEGGSSFSPKSMEVAAQNLMTIGEDVIVVLAAAQGSENLPVNEARHDRRWTAPRARRFLLSRARRRKAWRTTGHGTTDSSGQTWTEVSDRDASDRMAADYPTWALPARPRMTGRTCIGARIGASASTMRTRMFPVLSPTSRPAVRYPDAF